MNNVKDLQTIEETLKYLQFDNWEQSAPGLARSRELLGLLGNPEKKLKFVHIAGTDRKSTRLNSSHSSQSRMPSSA